MTQSSELKIGDVVERDGVLQIVAGIFKTNCVTGVKYDVIHPIEQELFLTADDRREIVLRDNLGGG